MLFIKNLRKPDFAPFGEVLEFSQPEAGFQVKVSEQSPTG